MKISQLPKETYRPKLKHPGGRPVLRLVAPKIFGKHGAEIYQGSVHKKCGTQMKYVSSGSCVRCIKQRDSRRDLQKRQEMWHKQTVKKQEAY